MAFPAITACLICEGARPEPAEKFTLLGYFGVCPNVAIGIRDFALPVELCFIFVGGVGDGKFRVGLRLKSYATGEVFGGEQVEGAITPDRPGSNIFLRYASILPGASKYQAILVVDDNEFYRTDFELKPYDYSRV